eukprot:g747.t1
MKFEFKSLFLFSLLCIIDCAILVKRKKSLRLQSDLVVTGQTHSTQGLVYPSETKSNHRGRSKSILRSDDSQTLLSSDSRVSSISQPSARVLVKCYFVGKRQASHDILLFAEKSYAYARDNEKNKIVFEGYFKPRAGTFQLTKWSYTGVELIPENLGNVCEQSVHNYNSNYVFTHAKAECQEGMSKSKCKTIPGGPYLSFPNSSKIPEFTIFGDSLSDVGSWKWYKMAVKFPNTPYYNGYYSNGYIWSQFLSKALHGEWQQDSDQGAVIPVTGFTSYAAGGSTTNMENQPGVCEAGFADEFTTKMTNLLVEDMWSQLEEYDKWERDIKSPFGILSRHKCDHDLACPSGSNSRCIGSSCNTTCPKRKKEICHSYRCICNEGFVVGSDGNCKKLNLPAQNSVRSAGDSIGVVWFGANDFLFGAQKASLADDFLNDIGLHGHKGVADRAAKSHIAFMDALVQRGFTSLAIGNVPNLGIIPMVTFVGKTRADQYTLSKAWSKMSQYYNDKISILVEKWKEDNPTIRVSVLDINSIFTRMVQGKIQTLTGEENFDYPGINLHRVDLISNPENGTDEIKVHRPCFHNKMVDQLGWTMGSSKICIKESESLFWDGGHPSTRPHCWIAYGFHVLLYKDKLVTVQPDFEKYKTMCAAAMPWLGKSEGRKGTFS